ncbi:MAG TPA: acetyl-CoA carboxylase biotin carboxyl carrier protein [Anaeromyxobacteraceae bacterium]|nr:acetyl-CoA carboxylase biotin carboxyl carrier protein [Anaeromyxobacteraceae bacterium]
MATRRVEPADRPKVAETGSAGPFTLDEVKALVKVLEGTDVTSLRWERNGQQVVIRRGRVTPPVDARGAPPPVLEPVPAAPAASASPRAVLEQAKAPPAEAAPGTLVTSPFVGTFYRAPSPEASPFVEVGDLVKKGQTLCIVEAMKLMNEIEAESPGKIAEILCANASPVEFGQALFRIVPA